ncbi:hypothetical protein AAMO2058_000835400 [Amorphochlora amoebiformis]
MYCLKNDHHFSAEFAHPIDYQLSEFLQSSDCVKALVKGMKPHKQYGKSESKQQKQDHLSKSALLPSRETSSLASRMGRTVKVEKTRSKSAARPQSTRQTQSMRLRDKPSLTMSTSRQNSGNKTADVNWKALTLQLRQQLHDAKEHTRNVEKSLQSTIQAERERYKHINWELKEQIQRDRVEMERVRADERAQFKRKLACEIRDIDGILRKEEEKLGRDSSIPDAPVDGILERLRRIVVAARQRQSLGLKRIKMQDEAIVDQVEEIRVLRKKLSEAQMRNSELRTAYGAWVADWSKEYGIEGMDELSSENISGQIIPYKSAGKSFSPNQVSKLRVRRELSKLAMRLKITMQKYSAAIGALDLWYAAFQPDQKTSEKGSKQSGDDTIADSKGLDKEEGVERIFEKLSALNRQATLLVDSNRNHGGEKSMTSRVLKVRVLLWEMAALHQKLILHVPMTLRAIDILKRNSRLSVQVELCKRRAQHAEAETERTRQQLAEVAKAQAESDQKRFFTMHNQLQELVKSVQRYEIRDKLWVELVRNLKSCQESPTDQKLKDEIKSLEQQLELVESQAQNKFPERLSWMPNVPEAVAEAQKSLKMELQKAREDFMRAEVERKKALEDAALWKEKAAELKNHLERQTKSGYTEHNECRRLYQLHGEFLRLHGDAAKLWNSADPSVT